MNPTDALAQSLDSWQPAGPGPHAHTSTKPGWQTTVTAESNDSMATRATEVTVTRTGPAPDGTTLRGWAESIAAKPAGLPEKLAIHEIDTDGGVAVLRSAEPTRKGDSVGYYEATLTGTDEAKLRRYTANTAERTPREPAPFVLTHETIAKVAEVLTGE
jgi:hypothetical protein